LFRRQADIGLGELDMTMASGGGTTIPPIDILQEVSDFSEVNDRQFTLVAIALENFDTIQRAKLRELAANLEVAQKAANDAHAARHLLELERDRNQQALHLTQQELQRSRYDNSALQTELQQTQQHLQAVRVDLQRFHAELDDTKSRLATAQTGRLTVENDNTELKGEVQRLLGVVSDQQADLTNLQSANDNVRRKFRRGVAVAAALIAVSALAAGLSTWMSWAQALAR